MITYASFSEGICFFVSQTQQYYSYAALDPLSHTLLLHYWENKIRAWSVSLDRPISAE